MEAEPIPGGVQVEESYVEPAPQGEGATTAETIIDVTSNEVAPEGLTEPTYPASQEGGFAALGLNQAISGAVQAMGYVAPTPIQAQAIPPLLQGRDVLGIAQTGTGKTASFTLPLIQKLTGRPGKARMPRALILEPTRELALQVAENLERYSQGSGLSSALLIGGTSMNEQRERLRRGADILIATPGRLLDLFERGALLLNGLEFLVIDEADRMLDMGFMPDIERIRQLVPAHVQTAFFSATMAPEMRAIADRFLKTPVEISIAPPASVASTITEEACLVADGMKGPALRRLLYCEGDGNTIVFCNRKRDVDDVQAELARYGAKVGHLHGGLDQSMRFETLERFRQGELKVLVCTDVAARGIDIDSLSCVINYDLPRAPEDYVHRVGRTGRAGQEGHAISLLTEDERPQLEAIEELTGHKLDQVSLDGLTPDASAATKAQELGAPPLQSQEVEPAPTTRQPSTHGRRGQEKRSERTKQREGRPTSASPAQPTPETQDVVLESVVEDTDSLPDSLREAIAPRMAERRAEPLPKHSDHESHQHEGKGRHSRRRDEGTAQSTEAGHYPLLKNGLLPSVPEREVEQPGFGSCEPAFMRVSHPPRFHSFS
ncbi:DEAD/DEAH box helicase [Formicincola oecophyllae]|uniref:DEAD-box ATP-dependent RNA helicase RhpA n=2 Tax=Formicincola oecophyllae TaxID=2558361 RepID=A0A4Y6U9V5_9PROT|nr:DEAD/DEAH box helicase [Formicincola oecophyllae]